MKHLLLTAVLLVTLNAAAAATGERQQLQRHRQDIEARFKRESLVCEKQFQVTACLEGLRAERRSGLKPIQAREDELDALDRKSRAQMQARRVAERQREFAAEEGRRRTAALQAEKAEQGGAAPAEGALPARTLPVDPQAHARSIRRQADEAAQAAAREREQSSRRQRLVLQHREAVQRRQDAQEASGRKPGKPLPIPTAAEIAQAASAASAAAR